MSSGLRAVLPEPTNAWQDELLDDLDELDGSSKIIADDEPSTTLSANVSTKLLAQANALGASKPMVNRAPPYLQRKNWVPRSMEDFGDGGAFPEIHIPQHPLKMGLKEGQSSGQIVALEVDETGKVKYDAIITQRMRKNTWVHSSFKDLVEKNPNPEDLAKPDEDMVQETTERTKKALEELVNTRIQSSKPTNSAMDANSGRKKGPTFLRYTPLQSGGNFNSGSTQRVVSLVEAQKDPLEPPKHRHKKVPGSIPSPPPPVQHSPPRKISAQDRQDWKIPSCISNWKNPKGYTIPLDKRMAADGSGVQQTSMNGSHAMFVDALYIAERQAREEVRQRNELAKSALLKQKQMQEEMLVRVAAESRKQRAAEANTKQEESTEVSGRHQRDQIREQRKREREDDRRDALKKSKTHRDRDRDISESIALGQAGKLTRQGEGLYDSRLFNQDQGMRHGLNEDDAYNIYDKPLLQGSSANQLYRPDKDRIAELQDGGEDELVDSLLKERDSVPKPGKAFEGTASAQKSRRDRPVEFERRDEDEVDDNDDDDGDADPFNIERFMDQAKKKA